MIFVSQKLNNEANNGLGENTLGAGIEPFLVAQKRSPY